MLENKLEENLARRPLERELKHFNEIETLFKNIMDKIKVKKNKRNKIIRRVRSKVVGTEGKPRLYVFKSNKHIYAGLAVDVGDTSKTIICVSDKNVGNVPKKPSEIASEIGKMVGDKAKEKGINKVVFDKRHYKYHGIVKNIADGARKAGLKF